MLNSYELSRQWFDFSFENPEKVKPNHTAIYFFIIEHCNRLGWKERFGLPTTMAMEALGIKSYNTYIKCFNDLVEWKFIKLIEKSKNQYSSNIIAISKFNKALDKALDKALINHSTKHCRITQQSIDSIIKQINQLNNKTIKQINNKTIEFCNFLKVNEQNIFRSSVSLFNVIDHETIITIKEIEKNLKNEFTWRENIIKNYREVNKDFDENVFNSYLEQFIKLISSDGEEYKTIQDTKKHFNRWLKIEIKKKNDTNNNEKNGASNDFRRRTFERVSGTHSNK
ncbi:hypothetical protein [uncultured Winogradskyella sp.]|uniref:DUF7833 domain-containing protein n=1 Tax=uncultured Winogradskyella sp. TaxID=395353 RepID=UPI00261E064F|nr:hypothetical protein [uncultured Winogradskyella sp.]